MEPIPPSLVNFWIAGTQKGGTTPLAAFLAEHPEIGMSEPKEPHFFDDEEAFAAHPVDFAAYHRRFDAVRERRVLGEATPISMYLPAVPERIHRYNPGARLVFLLRAPWDRAYSHYHMERSKGHERLPFAWALRAEPLRLARDRQRLDRRSSRRRHSYLDRGRYVAQIERFLARFPREQLLFLTSEGLRRDHEGTLARVHAFLGVSPVAPPAARAVFEGDYEPMPSRLLARLRRRFASERSRLEALTGLDLSAWDEDPRAS